MLRTRDPENQEAVSNSLFSAANFDREEIFNLCKTELNILAGLAMPDVFTLLFPAVHIALWDLMIRKVGEAGIFRLLLGLPRGHAKTTLVKLFVLWLILYGNRHFILIICASAPKAEAFLSDVWDFLSESNIIGVYGDAKVTSTVENKQQKVFTFLGREIILAAVGQGSVRGLNIKHRRPDVILFDDVQDKENAESPVESHKLLGWLQSTAMKLRDPLRCIFIFIGNMYRVPPDCVCVMEKYRDSPLWTSIITGAILEDGLPLWPELHPLDLLMEEFQSDLNVGLPEVFLAEMMNDIDADFNALIDTSKIPLSPFESDDQKVMCQGRFVTIDVATNKVGADDTVLQLSAIYLDGLGKDKVVHEGLMFGSLSPKQTILNALKICFQHGATVIAVESNAYQSSLLFWFGEIMKDGSISGIECVPIMAKGKKVKRILDYLRQLLAGDVYLANGIRQFVFKEALSYKPKKTNNTDNILDAGAHWQQVIEKYRFLIKLPTAIDVSGNSGLGVIEDNTSF